MVIISVTGKVSQKQFRLIREKRYPSGTLRKRLYYNISILIQYSGSYRNIFTVFRSL